MTIGTQGGKCGLRQVCTTSECTTSERHRLQPVSSQFAANVSECEEGDQHNEAWLKYSAETKLSFRKLKEIAA